VSESTPGDKPVEYPCRICDFIGPRLQYEEFILEVHHMWHRVWEQVMEHVAAGLPGPLDLWRDPTPRPPELTPETRALVEEAYRAAAQ
jgi:hypothetical protein